MKIWYSELAKVGCEESGERLPSGLLTGADSQEPPVVSGFAWLRQLGDNRRSRYQARQRESAMSLILLAGPYKDWNLFLPVHGFRSPPAQAEDTAGTEPPYQDRQLDTRACVRTCEPYMVILDLGNTV